MKLSSRVVKVKQFYPLFARKYFWIGGPSECNHNEGMHRSSWLSIIENPEFWSITKSP
jgi:hypothetical protein